MHSKSPVKYNHICELNAMREILHTFPLRKSGKYSPSRKTASKTNPTRSEAKMPPKIDAMYSWGNFPC